jgi:hypothetical protein
VRRFLDVFRVLFAVAMLVLFAGFAPKAHATCGAEGCPFIREGLGEHRGRFVFGFRFMDVKQDVLWSGDAEAARDELVQEIAAEIPGGGEHAELELFTRTRSYVFEGRARLNENLEFTASIPYLQREHRHMIVHGFLPQPSWEDTWKFEGLGDATVLSHYRARLPGEGHAFTLQAGVKLPTGRQHVPDEDRISNGFPSSLEPGIRPGSGSTDWLAGVQYVRPLPFPHTLPITASVLGRMNTKGTDDYEVGDELQAGLSGGYAPVERLSLLLQVNYSAHGSDQSADAAEAAHSGMRSLYLTPGVSMRLAPALSLYGLFQARVWGHTDDANVVGKSHFVIGTSYTLGH